jgi:S-methylmethionine-dependent homocysteine/selenocysteine methylase
MNKITEWIGCIIPAHAEIGNGEYRDNENEQYKRLIAIHKQKIKELKNKKNNKKNNTKKI